MQEEGVCGGVDEGGVGVCGEECGGDGEGWGVGGLEGVGACSCAEGAGGVVWGDGVRDGWGDGDVVGGGD